jgi:phage terminase large subunit GpA-like protein
MGIRSSVIDSGGEAGVTQQAYAFWRRCRDRRIIKHYGKVGGPNGRDVFNIMLSKGNNRPNQQKLAVVYPDTTRAANKAAARGEIPVLMFNTNLYKDDLLGQLLRVDPGPFYVHFPGAASPGAPHGLRGETNEPPHPWFEQLVAEARLPDGKWQLLSPSARNEALDLMVLTHVLAHAQGLNRIKWDRPSVWAAPWDFNPLVRPAPSTPPEGGPPTPGAGAPPPTVQVRIEGTAKPSIGKRLA